VVKICAHISKTPCIITNIIIEKGHGIQVGFTYLSLYGYYHQTKIFFFASTIYVTYFLFHFLKDIQAAIYSFIIIIIFKIGTGNISLFELLWSISNNVLVASARVASGIDKLKRKSCRTL
jgi:hypothetical protein